MGSRPRPAWPAFFPTPARVSSKRFRNHGIRLPLLVSLTALSGMQRKSWIAICGRKSYCRASPPACQPAGRNACLQIRTRLVVAPCRLPDLPMQATRLPLQKKGPRLKENWNDQDSDNVHHFDHGIDRRTGRVLVGIAYGVAGDRRGVRGRAFAAAMSFLDIFFGV